MKPSPPRPRFPARCRAALLAWAVLMLVLAPAGATLHAMTHLGQAPLRVLATTSSSAMAATQGVADDDEDGRGADAHCHTCDEWQVLDHVLLPITLPVLPPPSFLPHVDHTPRSAPVMRGPWILPRAPPRPHALNASAPRA